METVDKTWGESPSPSKDSESQDFSSDGSNSPDFVSMYDDPDRLEAPVLWLKYTYDLTPQDISSAILHAFDEHGVKNAEIVHLYMSTDPKRKHAYVILNSAKLSDLLLDGTITIVLDTNQGDGDEERILWFDEADHLEPKDTQDPYTIYLWQLDFDMSVDEIVYLFTALISKWSPICKVTPQMRRGNFTGALKVEMSCFSDTRKSIYMLNYARIEGVDIRAGFCNTDYVVRTAESTKGRERKVKKGAKQIEKPKHRRVKKPSRNVSPLPEEKSASSIKPAKNGWVEVTKTKSRNKRNNRNNKKK